MSQNIKTKISKKKKFKKYFIKTRITFKQK